MVKHTALAVCLFAGAVLTAPGQAASPPPPVEWKHEGLSELPEALARAKKSGRRVLIGLSGGPG